MATNEPQILDRPEAKPYNIKTLMGKLSRGEIRVPVFQRRLKWEAADAERLLDSVFRGYPVGTFLFWLRPARAENLRYGSVTVDAPEVGEALWVVDGQQRIHCLARVLLGRGAPEEEFALYFDLEHQSFGRRRRGEVPDHWLPMTDVLDEDKLQEWVYERKERLSSEYRQRAFRLGSIIRQFEIPSYAVRTSNESTVREIFSRINNSGKRMETHEVFDAIHGALSEAQPSRMSEIAAMLVELGFGDPGEELLYKMLAAILDHDVTSKTIPQLDPSRAKEAYLELDRAARAAARFMREDAKIPHASLLPYAEPMVALARYFTLHPEPSARTRELLTRWIWRGALTGKHTGAAISIRQTLKAIGDDEHRSVRELLRQIPREGTAAVEVSDFSTRTARGRLLALALLDLGPLHLKTAEPIVVNVDLYPHLIHSLFSRPPDPYSGSLANRLIHPPIEQPASALASAGEASILASHGVTREAQDHLRRGDREGFFRLREQTLKVAATDLFARRARWEEPDDLPIHALVVDEED
ncbi:DUF262 domain-containing protein [Nannocystis sp. ILAH1]|uniref:DUF262 domain-containing protein n=1 Tax=Nannocystis sp. ILAH1 TaxID=2996789 RepID=UPI002270D546|nr:DUF262 domain-containing protein [Nannocystis sp. ILAH1]MCY0995048.1 DUF262 domain-containing protein [Nannocystis sp. ILAH1]